MVRTRRTGIRDDQRGQPRQEDPMQEILRRLNEQQKVMEELRMTQARQEQERVRQEQEREAEREATIQAAVAAALAAQNQNAQPPPQQEPQPPPQQEPEPIPEPPPIRMVRPEDKEDVQQWVSKFCKHNPPTFEGSLNVQVAESWVMRLEKIFKVMSCPSEMRAQLAVYKLEQEADRWWSNTELILRARDIPITWEVFLEQFNQKYFPKSVQDEKEAEFLVLRQGDRESFDEYLARYLQLSRYSTYLQRTHDEEWNTERMLRGLRPALRERVAPMRITTFNTAVEVCRVTESSQNHHSLAKASTSTERPGVGSSSGIKKGKRPFFKKGFKKAGKKGNF